MSRAAAAPHGSTAPVKQPKFDSVFARAFVQSAMGLVKFPKAGEHAPVFIGIRVAEHYFLPSAPGVHQPPVARERSILDP